MAWLSLFLYIYTFTGKNKRVKINDFLGVVLNWQEGWLNGKTVKIISKYYIKGWRDFLDLVARVMVLFLVVKCIYDKHRNFSSRTKRQNSGFDF